jgi:hypothetical protein
MKKSCAKCIDFPIITDNTVFSFCSEQNELIQVPGISDRSAAAGPAAVGGKVPDGGRSRGGRPANLASPFLFRGEETGYVMILGIVGTIKSCVCVCVCLGGGCCTGHREHHTYSVVVDVQYSTKSTCTGQYQVSSAKDLVRFQTHGGTGFQRTVLERLHAL